MIIPTRHMVVNENRREGGVVGWCVVRDGIVFVAPWLEEALAYAGLRRDQTVEGQAIERGEEHTLGRKVLR